MARDTPPRGLGWRSSKAFICATVAVGLFTDLFLYGLVVPVLPFMLRDRIAVPDHEIQRYVSGLLAAYAGASVLSAVPAGWIADKTASRQAPFLSGLAALFAATILLAVGQTIHVLVVARILQGISASVVWTIGLAMVMDTVGPQNLGKVIGTIFSIISVGELLAPVLGGLLYDRTGYGGVFGVASGVLALDFLMRMLIVEKKTAAKYESSMQAATNPRDFPTRDGDGEEPSEEDALLPRGDDNDEYIIDAKHEGWRGKLFQAVPLLYCFRNPRLLVGLGLSLVQASLMAVFDATIPTEAEALFGFSSLESGLLFVSLDIPYLILGPIAGWAVDKYGTKPAAVLGFAYLVPALVLLRLPADKLVTATRPNVVLYCALLALNGVGLAVIGSPSIVEASDVIQRYDRANPGLFGPNGPYAQLYGFSSMFFSGGLTLGPVASGALKDAVGYGNMNLVFAVVAGLTAVVSFFVIGGPPRIWSRRK